MPLLEIWRATKDSVLSMNLETVVKMAGDGQLKDGSETSIEFRQFLTEVDSKKLAEYATYCTDHAFVNSGQVLQDVVNEIGRRLGFSAENGRYQGVRNDIGYDGIWSVGSDSLVIEVKTTNAYTIKLDVIATYRDRLADAGRVSHDSPILIVIGRDETESLEAQVRGSRHAWAMRIIGMDALIKLMEVNLSTSSKEVTEKIHAILKPIEYTRIDKIVDVIFSAAEDKDLDIDSVGEPLDYQDKTGQKVYATPQSTPREIIEKKKQNAIEVLSSKLNKVLVKKKYSLYSDQNGNVHAAVAISKRYERSEDFYWYAYHEVQRQFLSESITGFMVFGMSDLDVVFAVPYSKLEELRERLNSTIRDDGREYKHIFIYLDGEKYTMRLKAGEEIDLISYKI
jgi:hypothetical protein